MKKYLATILFFLLFFVVCNIVEAQMGMRTQYNEAKVESVKLTENIYKLVLNNIVNVIAFIGPDGVLLVDTGYDKNPARGGYINSPSAIKAELKRIGNDNIRYIINTHYHEDHSYGNTELGTNATIIGHQLEREQLLGIDTFPKEGLPNLTFHDSLNLTFNNEEINIFYLPGHSNNDIVVHFRKAKIVCVGDLIIPDSFGSISPTGNVYSMVMAIDVLLNRFSENITFVAGHDRVMNRNDLLMYKEMIQKTLEILVNEVNKGKEPQEMIKDDVLGSWKKWNGVLFRELNTSYWIMAIYKNISNKLSAAEKVAAILMNSTYESSKAEIQKMLAQKEKYYFLENEFIILGYNLMRRFLNDAIEIFKITVGLFPDAWNAYDSLGEAYMNAGNKKLAIENYEKSLALNPENTNAIDQLNKLKER